MGLDEDLLLACANKQCNKVYSLLKQGADPNSANELLKTPLHFACQYGWVSVVKLLINEYQCDPQVQDKEKKTPLHYACLYKNAKIVKLLLNVYNCDPNIQDSDQRTPPYYAFLKSASPHWFPLSTNHTDFLRGINNVIEGGTKQMVINRYTKDIQFGIAPGLNCDCLSKAKCHPILTFSNTAFQTTVRLTYPNTVTEIIREFIRKGIDLNQIDKNGNTLLHVACESGCLIMVKCLLEAKCDPNLKNNAGQTPLMTVPFLENSDHEIIRELINHGADPNVFFEGDGNTLLHNACKHGCLAAVKYFLEANCDPNLRNNAGMTPIQITSFWNINIIVELVRKGANPYVPIDKDGRVAIYIDCTDEKVTYIKLMFLKENTDSSIAYQTVHRPKLIFWNTDITKVLFKADIEPNLIADIDGNTLLHKACQDGRLDLVHSLLELECDPNCKNKAGKAPIEMASVEYTEIIALLVERGADVNKVIDDDGNNNIILHTACRHRTLNTVKYLLEANCDPNSRNNFEQTSLQLVPFWVIWSVGIVKALIQKGADPNVPIDDEGNTLLHIACRRGELAVVQFLLKAKCDPNRMNSAGQTPIQVTSLWNINIIVKLVRSGANPYLSIHKKGHVAIYFDYSDEDVTNIKFLKENDDSLICIVQKKYRPKVMFWNTDIIKELVKADIEPNLTVDNDGNTLLHKACQDGRLDIVRYLLEVECDPNCKNSAGNTPLKTTLIDCPTCNKSEICTLLVERVRDANKVVDDDGNTILHIACSLKSLALNTLKCLLGANCDPNSRNNFEQTPLQLVPFWSIDSDNIIKALIQKGADPYIPVDDGGNTVLHIACSYGKLDSVQFLLKAKCDPNCINSAGQTPIHVTSLWNMDIMVELVRYGANPCVPIDKGGHVAIYIDCTDENVTHIRFMFLKDNNDSSIAYQTVHNPSVMFWNISIIKELVKAGIELNIIVDIDGNTLLHNACQGEYLQDIIFQLLFGDERLKARQQVYLDTVKCLLEANCDPNSRNNSNQTPLQLVPTWYIECDDNDTTIIIYKAFIQKGADPYIPVDDGGNTQ